MCNRGTLVPHPLRGSWGRGTTSTVSFTVFGKLISELQVTGTKSPETCWWTWTVPAPGAANDLQTSGKVAPGQPETSRNIEEPIKWVLDDEPNLGSPGCYAFWFWHGISSRLMWIFPRDWSSLLPMLSQNKYFDTKNIKTFQTVVLHVSPHLKFVRLSVEKMVPFDTLFYLGIFQKKCWNFLFGNFKKKRFRLIHCFI